MDSALLIIGDGKNNHSILDYSCHTFNQHIENLSKEDSQVFIRTYKNVTDNKLPDILSTDIFVMLFFPYNYWNKHIEVYKKDLRVYGDRKFGKDYKKYFEKIEKTIRKKYQNKKIHFINPPKSSLLERDKKEAKSLFKKNSIPTPRSFDIKRASDFEKITKKGTSIYMKPRYGSMGKGITYLSKDIAVTNFLFRKGKIVSRLYDYNWKVYNVKNNDRKKFLKNLLGKDFIFEQAISSPTFKNRKFDMRIYCIYGKVPYCYARSAPAESLVTNWSQGGNIEKGKKLHKYIPPEKVEEAKSLALKVAKKLNLNYAGVDVIFSKDFKNAYVLEAHSFPGFEKGFDLMKYLACEILRNKKKGFKK